MNLTGLSDEQILDVVNPLMDNLMEGSREIDHAKHTRDFTQRMKDIVTAERLEEMCTEYRTVSLPGDEIRMTEAFRDLVSP